MLGVGEATVYRDLSGFPNEKPERPSESTGADGKTYPSRQRTEAERQELIERAQESEQNQLLSSGSAVHFLYSSA